MLQHVVNIVAREMGYSDCVILIPDKEAQHLVASAGMGLSEGFIGESIPGRRYFLVGDAERIPQNIPDVLLDERSYDTQSGVGSELYIPLEVRGRRLGVLIIQKAEKGGFGTSDIRLLMASSRSYRVGAEVAQLHEQVKKAAM